MDDASTRKPVILTVDDDPAVSRAVARDLRRRYGEEYRIVRAESGAEALDALRELKLRGDQVAVLLADYRMPQMNGIEFLEQAMDLYPQRAAGAAHRVRRHRRGDRRDQRRRPRPLPAQAVGPAGGEALPGARRPARGVAAQRPPRPSTRPRWSGTAGRRGRPRSGTSWPATRCRTAGTCRDEPGGRAAARRRPAPDDTTAAGGDHRGRRRAGRADATPSWPTQVGLATTPVGGLLRPRRHRRRPGRARRGGVRRLRGAAHGAGRADGDRRAGRAELPHRELPRLPRRRLRRAAHRPGPPAGR